VTYNPDDKDVALICITIVAIVACFTLSSPETVLTGAVTALGALATGRNGNGK
jgi:hypothetical protein